MEKSEQLEQDINFFAHNRFSFLLNEILMLYRSTNDAQVKVECLKLLDKIG